MNKIICSIFLVALLLAGCFKDYEKRYLFHDETQVEFEDAVVNANASGKDYPMLSPLNSESGMQKFRVNLIGPQNDTPTVIHFMVLPDESSAIEGRDYELPQGDTIQISPHSSFGWLKVKVLPGGSGNPTLVFKLLGNEKIKGAERYSRIGFQILFPFTPPDPHEVDSLNDIIFYKNILLGSYNNDNIGGCFDLKTGNAYTIDGADDNQADIDMILLRSSSTEMNFLAPATSSVTAWGATKHIPDEWSVRNDGTFIKLSNPSVAEEAMFESASSVEDLLLTYNHMLATLSTRPGYSASSDGPSNRIRSIVQGDIILFYSDVRSQVAIMKVGEVVPGSAGSIQLQVKTGTFDPGKILLSSTVQVGGWSKYGAYGRTFQVDLAAQAAYDTSYSNYHSGDIDMLNLYSGSGYINFMTPANSAVTAWGASKHIANDPWPVRNTGVFVHLDHPTPAEEATFNQLFTRNQLEQAFDQAESTVTGRAGYSSTDNGPGSRVRHIEEGDLIYFKSTMPNRDLYAVMKIIKITLGSSNGRESIDILVKSNLKTK